MSLELSTPSTEGPRFDLRFERGRVQLRLGRPLVLDGLELEHLVVSLDFRGPVDLRGGARRFRHHRGRVVELRARVRPTKLATSAAEARTLRVDDAHAARLRLAYRDEAGVLSLDGALAFDGVDLVWQPRELGWVRGSPRSAWDRFARLATALGSRAEPTTGTMRFERPVRAILAELFLPHGWRVPDERGCGLRATDDGESIVLEAGERIVGPRLPQAPSLDFEASEPSGAPGALRASLDAADLDAAVRAHRELRGWLAAEAALAIAERFEHALEPDALVDWLLRGLASFPEDERAWRRWTSRLAERGALGALRLADVALAGPLSRASRAELAVRAATGVLDAFGDPQWSDEPGVDPMLERRLRRIVSEASALAPESGRVLAARAALAHREGSLAEAARFWERAADAAEDRATASDWRRRAGQLLLGLEGPAAAEPLLRRALEESSNAPEVLAELASVLVERGDLIGAEELYARLLKEPHERGPERRAALLCAARHHLERGAPDRARPFLSELGDDPVSLEMQDELSDADADDVANEPLSGEHSVVLYASPETSQVLSPSGQVALDDFDDEGLGEEDELFDDEGVLEELDDDALDQLFEESPRPRHLRAVDKDDPLESLVLGTAKREAGGDAGHLDSWLPRLGAKPPASIPPNLPPPPLPPSGLPPMTRSPSGPPVTLVSVADDELRALLEAVAESDDPGALLEGALEEALTDADADGVRRVLRVLQRVDDFAGAAALAARARRLLERLDEEP